MPATMQKRVSPDHLYNTFKPYKQHLMLQSGSGQTWHDHLEEVSGSFCAIAQEKLTGSSGRVLVTAFEAAVDVEETESSKTDAILFPSGLSFSNVSKKDLEVLCGWIASGSNESAPIPSTPIETKAFVLVCSHKRRDKKCGVAGPILISQFKNELEAMGVDNVSVHGVSHFGGFI